jgi:sulfatase maturation enzyme AslB (radical SAM superfamily)
MDEEFINLDKVIMPNNIPKINFNKRAGIYEISCSLFTSCNLNCNFCFQDHNCKLDTQKIMEIPSRIINVIKQDMIDYGVDKKIYIRIYGGEPFFDELSDSIFMIYRRFFYLLKDQLNTNFPKCSIEVYWGSNGVFKNHQRVKSFLKDTNSFIALSYDSVDRFHNGNQKDTWLKTLKFFHNNKLLSSVSVMLIKPSLLKYLSGDIYFNQIPQDVSIDVNQYISNPDYEKYLMTDEDIFTFYEWCINRKLFNVEPINNAISNYLSGDPQRHCYCKCSNFFDANGTNTKDCVSKYSKLPAEDFYGEHSSQITEENCTEVKNYLGLQKRGCLFCEYYTFCPTVCWTSIIFKNYITTVCPYQRLFDYLNSNPKVVEDFKEWRIRHEGSHF